MAEVLEPSDSPSKGLEANLGTLTDDEYFEDLQSALDEGIYGLDSDGKMYRLDEGVKDLRGQK